MKFSLEGIRAAATIYILHESEDTQTAEELVRSLVELGYETTAIPSRESVRGLMYPLLKVADVIIILGTQDAEVASRRHSFISQVVEFLSYNDQYKKNRLGDILCIPVLFQYGVSGMSPRLELTVIDANKISTSEIIDEIEKRVVIHHQRYIQKREAIERNLSEYVGEVIEPLKKRERRDYQIGLALNAIGLVILFFGFYLALRGVTQIEGKPQTPLPFLLYLSLKNVVVVGILFVACKYAFTLGKTYINESLKSSDRVHAIEFGRFYLRAFGDQVTKEDVKEVFQDWNTSSSSSFASLSSDAFDPKIEDKAIELAKVIVASAKALKS